MNSYLKIDNRRAATLLFRKIYQNRAKQLLFVLQALAANVGKTILNKAVF